MYTNNKGFHIQLKYTKNKLPNLPDNLILVYIII